MEGVRILGQPLFAELFAPVFNELRGLSWITLEGAFQFPTEWLDASTLDPATESFVDGPCANFQREVLVVSDGPKEYGYFSKADLFPKYAAAVSEDWCSIFGLDDAPTDVLRWYEGYYAAEKDRAAYLGALRVAFLNVDAAYWEFYSRDDRLSSRLLNHLRGLDVKVEPCALETSYGL